MHLVPQCFGNSTRNTFIKLPAIAIFIALMFCLQTSSHASTLTDSTDNDSVFCNYCTCDQVWYDHAEVDYDPIGGQFCIWLYVNFKSCPQVGTLHTFHLFLRFNNPPCGIVNGTSVITNNPVITWHNTTPDSIICDSTGCDTIWNGYLDTSYLIVGHIMNDTVSFTNNVPSTTTPCSVWAFGYHICGVLSGCGGAPGHPSLMDVSWSTTHVEPGKPTCTGGYQDTLRCANCSTIDTGGSGGGAGTLITYPGMGNTENIDYIAADDGTIKEEICSMDGIVRDIHILSVTKGEHVQMTYVSHENDGAYLCRVTQGQTVTVRKFSMIH